MSSLVALSLFGNQFASSLPGELGALEKLEYLYFNNNAVTGAIPTALSKLTNLEKLILYDNKLSGCQTT
jgi:Leucine-rich repeat (LRR) protein